jgi:hypothetical protein
MDLKYNNMCVLIKLDCIGSSNSKAVYRSVYVRYVSTHVRSIYR